MRTCLCLCALLVPSAAWAERIEILAVDAARDTRTDALSVSVALSQPMDLDFDLLQIWLSQYWPAEPGIADRREYSLVLGEFGTYRDGTVEVAYGHTRFGPGQPREVVERETMRMPIDFDDHASLAFSMPRNPARFSEQPFHLRVQFIDGDGFILNSEIDSRVHAPEPSALALAGIGVVALVVHSVRRPGSRQRRRERGVGRNQIAG